MRKKVYHITYPKNREPILENGLLPKKSEKYILYEPRIFVFLPKEENDVLLAFYYTRDENMDIWEFEVDFNSLNKDENSNSDNHFWIDFIVYPKLYKSNINMWEVSLKRV